MNSGQWDLPRPWVSLTLSSTPPCLRVCGTWRIESQPNGGNGVPLEDAILVVLSKALAESHRVVFNGNCYTAEWEQEAGRRGLSNWKSTPEALKAAFTNPKETAFLLESGVLNRTELDARYEIKLEQYATQVEIEARTLQKLIRKDLRPAMVVQLADLEALGSSVFGSFP